MEKGLFSKGKVSFNTLHDVSFCFVYTDFILTSWLVALPRDFALPIFISRRILAISPHPGRDLEILRHAIIVFAYVLVLAVTTRATLMVPAHENDPGNRLFSLWVATAILLLPVAWDYDLTLMLIPFAQLTILAVRGEASRRAIAMAVVSYLLLVWWEYFAQSGNEGGFLAMVAAYLSAYWLATDQPASSAIPFRALPTQLIERLRVPAFQR
jgi:hypothetical protein